MTFDMVYNTPLQQAPRFVHKYKTRVEVTDSGKDFIKVVKMYMGQAVGPML